MTPVEIAAELNRLADGVEKEKYPSDQVIKAMNLFLKKAIPNEDDVEIRVKGKTFNVRTGWQARDYRSFYLVNLDYTKGKDGQYGYPKFDIKEKNIKAIIEFVAKMDAKRSAIDNTLSINAKITDFIINTDLTQYQPSVFGGGIEFRIKTKDLETDGIYNPTYGGYIVKLTKLGWIHHEPTIHVPKVSALQAAADFYHAVEARTKELKSMVTDKYPELLEMIKEYK